MHIWVKKAIEYFYFRDWVKNNEYFKDNVLKSSKTIYFNNTWCLIYINLLNINTNKIHNIINMYIFLKTFFLGYLHL